MRSEAGCGWDHECRPDGFRAVLLEARWAPRAADRSRHLGTARLLRPERGILSRGSRVKRAADRLAAGGRSRGALHSRTSPHPRVPRFLRIPTSPAAPLPVARLADPTHSDDRDRRRHDPPIRAHAGRPLREESHRSAGDKGAPMARRLDEAAGRHRVLRPPQQPDDLAPA